MAKRLFDIVFASVLLFLTLPIWFFAALGIWVASNGPVLYFADRAGRNGQRFALLKFRTMHCADVHTSPITAPNDPRVFAFGSILRQLKLDEIPQLLNILRGEMSFVGPRPEDPAIIDKYCSEWMLETLTIRPGLTSVGALFHYRYSDSLLDPNDPEGSYVRNVLPAKLALERAYIERASFISDFIYICRTGLAVLGGGRYDCIDRKDVALSLKWVEAVCLPSNLLKST